MQFLHTLKIYGDIDGMTGGILRYRLTGEKRFCLSRGRRSLFRRQGCALGSFPVEFLKLFRDLLRSPAARGVVLVRLKVPNAYFTS